MEDTPVSSFTLMLDKAGYFKRNGSELWWIGLKENKILSDLQSNLSEGLSQKGFPLENRKYTPHVTIGREVKLRDGFVHPEVRKVGFTIKSIELMKSEHARGKLVYTPVFSKMLVEI
jgi:2'-5' RNA ligase